MSLPDNKSEKIITIISVLFFICIVTGLIFYPMGKSGTRSTPQTKVNQSDASGLVARTTAKQDHRTDEWADQSMDGVGGLDIPRVREAANAYVEANEPGCAAKGFSSTAINGNLYFVAVDLTCAKARKTVNLVARRFFTLDQKSSYWKADLLSKDLVGLALTESESEISQDQ